MRPDAVFFDLFGTLVSEESDYRALDATFDEVETRFALGEDPRVLAGDYAVMVMELMQREPRDARPAPVRAYQDVAKDVFAALMSTRNVEASDDDVAWFWETHVAKQREEVVFFQDAEAGVRAAAEHARHVGIITDADAYLVHLLLPSFAAADLVQSVTTGAEAGVFKPHRPIFHLAAKKAEAHPGRCVMVGDSLERDVEGARAAGMRAVLLDRRGVRTYEEGPVVRRLTRLGATLATF